MAHIKFSLKQYLNAKHGVELEFEPLSYVWLLFRNVKSLPMTGSSMILCTGDFNTVANYLSQTIEQQLEEQLEERGSKDPFELVTYTLYNVHGGETIQVADLRSWAKFQGDYGAMYVKNYQSLQ
jgi:hypothetical protein